jgi:hypothetical protein
MRSACTMVHRALDAEQIDTIIATAPERARRVYWNGVLENAADFATGLDMPSRFRLPNAYDVGSGIPCAGIVVGRIATVGLR